MAEKEARGGGAFESPKKRYEKSRQRIFVNDYDRDAGHRKIHHIYEHKQHLTLTSIQQVLIADGLYYGGRTLLSK